MDRQKILLQYFLIMILGSVRQVSERGGNLWAGNPAVLLDGDEMTTVS